MQPRLADAEYTACEVTAMSRPLVASALTLAACTARPPGDGDRPSPPAHPVELHGAVAKGPFVRGSTVTVSPVDVDGMPTGDVYLTETTDDAGQFAVTIAAPGAVRLDASGFYYNEVTGTLSTAPITLRAYDDLAGAGDQASFVNVYTHVVGPRVQWLMAGGADVDDATAQAEQEARLALHVAPEGFDPAGQAGTMDLLGGDTTPNAYLFAMSTVLTQAAADRAGPDGPLDAVLTEMLNGIAADFADGALDGGPGVPVGAELYALQATIDADGVMALLAARFDDIGSSAVVPDLHRVFDLDLDGVVDLDDPDADGDAHVRTSDGGDDCDDYDPARHPGAPEDFGDGVDADCTSDTDGDGFVGVEASGDDCDDGDPSIHPGATETWYDAVDSDCDGASDFDRDGDGFDVAGDCDDVDGAIHPDATETCATPTDDDCDATANTEGGIGCLLHYLDTDGDGFGALSSGDPRCLCFAEDGYVLDGTDCDDDDGDRSPATLEDCVTPFDDDCDGDVVGDADGDDVADVPPALGCVDYFVDADGDGLGAGPPQCLCTSDSMSLSDLDCDDASPSVGGPTTWYPDGDGDGWGDPSAGLLACTAPPGYVADGTDCDDADPVWTPDFSAAMAVTTSGGGYPIFATAADLDGDGDLDVLQANDVNSTLSWTENLGGRTFGAELAIDASQRRGPVAAADLDGDGDPDVIEATQMGDQVRWTENLGGGAFGPPQVLDTACAYPSSVAAADLDGDGDLDVAETCQDNATVAWIENVGAAGFGARRVVSASLTAPYSVAAGDIDRDGRPDLVVGSWDLHWYQNLGNGAFAVGVALPSSAALQYEVAIADLDGDAWPDVVGVSQDDDRVTLFPNSGGVFTTEIQLDTPGYPFNLATGDLDGDGDLDVVAGLLFDDAVVWWQNAGGFAFTRRTVGDVIWPRDVAVADLDADGYPDVLAAHNAGTTWFAGQCGG